MTAPPLEPHGDLTVVVPAGPGMVGRSPAAIAWRRLRRDRVAMAGGVVVIGLVLVAITAPLIVKVLGDPPDEFH
ncbi:MAG TPA: hypothetical protein VGL04_11265, partial [Sporichthyaceae bacterium]